MHIISKNLIEIESKFRVPFIFGSLFLGIIWPQKLFLNSIALNTLMFTFLIVFQYLKKNYNLLVYTILSLSPYFVSLNILTETLNPAVYVFLFICSIFFNTKKDCSVFLFSALVLIMIFIGEYIYKFSIPCSYSEIYNNKLMLGTDLSLQSFWFGNIHNILPFAMTVSALAISFLLKKENEVLAFISFVVSYIFFYLYLGRLCLYFMFFSAILVLVKKAFDLPKPRLSFLRIKEYKRTSIIRFFLGFFGFIMICISLIQMDYHTDGYILLPLKGVVYKICSLVFQMPPLDILEKDISTSGRLQAYTQGIQILRNTSYEGVGINQYSVLDPVYTSPHNFMVKLIVETGILGFLFLAFVIFKIIRATWRNPYQFPIITFMTYTTLVGADLILGRLCINYIILTFLFIKICSPKEQGLAPVKSPLLKGLPNSYTNTYNQES